MKKCFAVFLVLLYAAVLLFSVSASAVSITRLPVGDPINSAQISDEIAIPSYQPKSYTLQKNTVLNTNLTVKEGEVLFIPKGKKLTLKKGKTVTVNGGIYIEEGGSLVIENGTLTLKERGTILSYGKLNLKKNGKITLEDESTFIISESGSLTEKGTISEKGETASLICIGNYTGEKKRKTEILAAVSIDHENYTDKLRESRFYDTSDAKALFPTLSPAPQQELLAGAMCSTDVFFYCANDQWFSYTIQGDFESKTAIVGNMIVQRP